MGLFYRNPEGMERVFCGEQVFPTCADLALVDIPFTLLQDIADFNYNVSNAIVLREISFSFVKLDNKVETEYNKWAI